jgi:trigger factor
MLSVAMKTTVSELPDSRVRVEVGVEAEDVDRRVEDAARRLGRELRIPGFRKGKVPPQIVLQRVGRAAVMEQALRDALPEWYERAVLDSGISPVGDPQLDMGAVPESAGAPLEFSIEVAVRPKANLGQYKGLEVGRAEPEVPAETVDAELERLREGFGSLNPVDRPAREGDNLLIDYRGVVDGEPFEGGEGRDELIELGGGRLLEDFERGLAGASATEQHTIEVEFPDDYAAEQLAGKTATFTVDVKEVREKELPPLDDEFAADASEFDTLEELRSNIESRLREAFERRSEDQFREAAVDAAVAEASVELPEDVVAARAQEMWERIERSLSARGVSPETYLQMQGRNRGELIEDARPDAERALKREAVLEAIVAAEGIEVTEEEMLAALANSPDHEGHEHDPSELLERLRQTGRDALLREDLRLRKAIDLIAENAKPIPIERAEARERLWTPEKEAERRAGEGERSEGAKDEPGTLWTPGS